MSIIATYRIDFSETDVGNEGYIDVSIDPDQNNGKSIFSPGDEVVLSVITSSPIKEVWASAGTLHRYGNYAKEFTEYFAIDKKYGIQKTLSLHYKPETVLSHGWLGGDNGNVVFDGKVIHLPDGNYFGYLKVEYKVNIFRYQLRSVSPAYSESNICLFFVNEENIVTSHTVVLNQPDIEQEEDPSVSIVVKDFATEDVVPGCIVKVDGKTVGVTDDNGYCYIGKLKRGRHDLKLEPPQPYLNSDQDGLANDWFTVD